MQTIRIYFKDGSGIAAKFSGAPNRVETEEMRRRYPENQYSWLR
jgi:hypothetical protein